MAKDFIDDMFGELEEFYPGSKRKRKEPVPMPEVDTSWEADATIKVLPNGRQIETYTLVSLARALNRPVPTLRQWMDRGKLPSSPYRLPSNVTKDGKEILGSRIYSKAMIKIAVELFAKSGILDSERVNWNTHRTLSDKIAEAWETIRAEENK